MGKDRQISGAISSGRLGLEFRGRETGCAGAVFPWNWVGIAGEKIIDNVTAVFQGCGMVAPVISVCNAIAPFIIRASVLFWYKEIPTFRGHFIRIDG